MFFAPGKAPDSLVNKLNGAIHAAKSSLRWPI